MKMSRVLPLAALLCAPLAPTRTVRAEPPLLGLSGLFDLDPATWEGLGDGAKLAFYGARADLARSLGASAVRLGSGAPDLFSESALQGTFPWLVTDRVVGALGARDLDLVVTLTQPVPASQKTAYRQFMTHLVERYDGDGDFGVSGAEVQFDHPDLDDSGAVSVADWNAPAADKASWGSGHLLARIEVGDRVREAEEASVVVASDYAAQLGAVAQAISGSSAALSVVLAGTDMDRETKARFLERLSGADLGRISAAGAHFRTKVADLDSARALTALDAFLAWRDEAGLGAAEAWVTELSVGAAPAGSGPGPCVDPRCSPRTQVHGLVRLVLSALAKGYTRVYYHGGLEIDGQASTVGLVTGPATAALNTEPTGLAPRPAYAVWRKLPEILAGAAPTKLGALPTNVAGVRVATGHVLWFDWTLEVGPGQPYDAMRRKEVELRGLTTPSVRVVSLWPTDLGSHLGTDGAVDARWDETLVPVDDAGTAVVTVGEDPVWVVPSDVVVGAELDEGDVSAPDAADTVEVAPAGPASDGGCQGGLAGSLLAWLGTVVAVWRGGLARRGAPGRG